MTRFLYLVDAIPADEPGVTADVPAGVGWCGNTDGTSYVVVTDAEVDRFLLVDTVPADDPAWEAKQDYTVGNRRMYDSIVYRCIQSHTNFDPGHTPPLTPALWTPARSDGDPWVQPTMAEDAYGIGRIVAHVGFLWSSKINANTTTPGTDDRWWVQVANITERAQTLIDNGGPFAVDDPALWSVGGA